MISSDLFRPTKTKRALFFIFGDVVLSLFTLFSAYLLRFNFSIPSGYIEKFFAVAAMLIGYKIVFYALFKLYFVSWRFFSLKELKSLLFATLSAYIVGGSVLLLFRDLFIPFPRSVIIIDFFLSILFIGLFRISKRLLYEKISTDNPPAVVIGANEKTISLLKQNLPYSIIEIFDDEPNAVGTYLYGYKVENLTSIDDAVKTAIITKELSQNKLDDLVEYLHRRGVEEIKIYNPFEERIKDISIEDLLARKPKDLDKATIEVFVKDKTILITGAGGSIGSELVRQCVKFGSKKLILVDHSEYNLYTIEQEMEGKADVACILQSVVNKEQLQKTFALYKPQIVIHAAAYKHVPLVEENIQEAIINNVLGTKNCIDLSIKNGVEKFILISTDKAVRPTNVMGATKRVCELYAQNVVSLENSVSSENVVSSKNTILGKTEIVSVRFGNVLGSSGSVIPKFRKQIANGGPVTVTHPEITRYFMLISEACQLVLQAGAIGKGSEIFILDMGEPVKIVDLAKKMIKLSGKTNVEITFTGLRPGEKLYEELFLDESKISTKYTSITIAPPTRYDIEKLQADIEQLLQSKTPLKALKRIVPEFTHDVDESNKL